MSAKEPPSPVAQPMEPESLPTADATCDIRYTYNCCNYDGPNFTETSSETPLNLKISEQPAPEAHTEAEKAPRVFEIITDIDVREKRKKENVRVGSETAEDEPVRYAIKNMHITDIEQPRMVIHSVGLAEAVREVVEYYPSQNLLGDTITVREPYHVLMHHAPELKRLKAELERQDALEKAGEDTIEKCRHIEVLLNFLEPKLQRIVPAATKRLQKEDPTVLFADIWFSLRPGCISYFSKNGVQHGCVIKKVSFRTKDDEQPNRWEVCVWFQDHAWRTAQRLGTVSETITIEEYDGEKRVMSLPVFPRDYHDRTDGGQRRKSFEDRGKVICDIIWKGHSYMNCKGKLMDETSQEYQGPVMVGNVGVPDVDFSEHDWHISWDESITKGPEGLRDPARCGSSELVDPLDLDPTKHSRELISNTHAFLVCPIMGIFNLQSKNWACTHIDSLTEIGTPSGIPDANIGPENLKIIKALSDRQIKTKVPWSADFIKDKGEGVVVLLHGPPGVGKTYTVETTALSTGRPLISLTIADLGTKEEKIEGELTRWFTLAQKWRAVLLIDEADIFLERRQHRDIARNGVVSAFLRKIEYFGGLLFLTTNRVGHIDEAFMSRVHVIIGFEKLNHPKRQAIWKSFLDKLARERQGQIRVDPTACEFLMGPEMGDMDWNGREIRNAFQTAIALAEFAANDSPYHREGDEIIVVSEHFRKVMDMSRSFHSYLDSIRNDTEEERANAHYARNDYFSQRNLSTGHSREMKYDGGLDLRLNNQLVGSERRTVDAQQMYASGMRTEGQFTPGFGSMHQMDVGQARSYQ